MCAIEVVLRCAWCGRVNEGGKWVAAESDGSPAGTRWSHGICPDCVRDFGFETLADRRQAERAAKLAQDDGQD